MKLHYGWVVVAVGALATCIGVGAMFALPVASSLGMALGPAAGGWIFDTFHSYAWLYIGSFGVGLGAAAIALAFPPVRAGGARPVAQAA